MSTSWWFLREPAGGEERGWDGQWPREAGLGTSPRDLVPLQRWGLGPQERLLLSPPTFEGVNPQLQLLLYRRLDLLLLHTLDAQVAKAAREWRRAREAASPTQNPRRSKVSCPSQPPTAQGTPKNQPLSCRRWLQREPMPASRCKVSVPARRSSLPAMGLILASPTCAWGWSGA